LLHAVMKNGFLLFIDEAGDEGLDRVRPLDPNGASEYFVLAGVLVRTTRYAELVQSFNAVKISIGKKPSEVIHFRDLTEDQRKLVVKQIGRLKVGLVAIVSNKRNMLRYRNTRCETKIFEIVKGRQQPKKQNWFYNNLFRYLLERASEECAKWTHKAFGEVRTVKVIFSRRKEFSYAQTRAYLYKLKVERRDANYFNNKRQPDWTVLDIPSIESKKDKDETGLQIADCVASAIYRSIDENWFGKVQTEYLADLAPKFIKLKNLTRDYGFKLLPDQLNFPTSYDQKISFRYVGYELK
jgi:hypothetical protein